MPARENIFVTWIKAKSKAKGLKTPNNLNQIFKADRVHLSKYLQQLASDIIELGDRDGELGIQAMILLLQGAERVNQVIIPYIHSALDTVVSGLGFDNRNELISFFDVPEVKKNTPYNPSIDKTFDDRMADVYSAVLKNIQEIRPNIQVTLPRIAELAKTPKKYVVEIINAILEQKPALGEFLSLEQVFIRRDDTDEIIDDLISNPIPRYGHFHCSHCGEIIEDRSANTCPSCEKDILRCIVCKLPISSDDSIGKCSHCDQLAHLTHLQEWIKVNGKCPSCLQKTEVIIVKETIIESEEKLPYGIDLSKIRIVQSGEWKDVPETTIIEDISGFFNMLFASTEKKLLHWTKGKSNYIGFFESGKLFTHFIERFDSIKEYLIATKLGFKGKSAPESLKLYREARSHGWVDRKIAIVVWEAINKDYVGIPLHLTHSGGESEYKYKPTILNHPFIQEKYQKVLSLRPRRGLVFEMLPPFDPECLFGEDWFVWFLGYHNGWNSFEELNNFAKNVFPEINEEYLPWIEEQIKINEQKRNERPNWYDFDLSKKKSSRKPARFIQKIKIEEQYLEDRNDRFLKLVYLAVHGPFKEEEDWLQGWPNFDSLMRFWINTDDLKYILESRNQFIDYLRVKIETEILPLKAYPAILPYDSSCKTAFDWVLKAVELKNWSSVEVEIIKEARE